MKKLKIYRTDVLFPKSNFLIGMGSIGNLFGNYYKYNTSPTSSQADMKAALSVWGVIGMDIRYALSKLAKTF